MPKKRTIWVLNAFPHEEDAKPFHISLSFANLAPFLLCRTGISPKSESGVGLTQLVRTR